MIVRMYMSTDVASVEADVSIGEAAALMARRRIRRMPVVDEKGRLVGIVSATDLYRAFPPSINPFSPRALDAAEAAGPVRKVMATHLSTTRPDSPVEEAARVMREKKIGALPVVENGRLAGMITESDIFRAFADLFASPRGSARVSFSVRTGEDVFGLVGQLAARHGVHVLSMLTVRQDGEPVCVLRIAGGGITPLIDELARSGHPPLNLLRF